MPVRERSPRNLQLDEKPFTPLPKQKEDKAMTECVYNVHGSAVGFHCTRYVYRLDGNPIGQLNGTHVHKLSGSYVGELYKDMVVNQHAGNLGNIGNPGNPGNPGSPGNPGNRGSVNYGYPDVFDELLED